MFARARTVLGKTLSVPHSHVLTGSDVKLARVGNHSQQITGLQSIRTGSSTFMSMFLPLLSSSKSASSFSESETAFQPESQAIRVVCRRQQEWRGWVMPQTHTCFVKSQYRKNQDRCILPSVRELHPRPRHKGAAINARR